MITDRVFISIATLTENDITVRPPDGIDNKFSIRIGAMSVRLTEQDTEILLTKLNEAHNAMLKSRWANARTECGVPLTYAWDAVGACDLPMGHAGRHAIKMED